MLPFGVANTVSSAVPIELWVWGAASVLLAVCFGFTAGYYYAKQSVRWAMQRAKTRLSSLYAMVLETLDTAQEACAVLERFPQLRLTDEQTSQLDGKRGKLLQSIASIVAGQIEQTSPQKQEQQSAPFQLDWARSPEDSCTGLPDRSAFDINLASLLEACTRSDRESGLLLIKVDKLDQLKARFGQAGAERLLKKMAGVICRALRDEDIVGRFSDDSYAVLIPDVDVATGRKMAEAIRGTVRHHKFRHVESGPEVLVTASFGFTGCRPHDNADLVLNRAGDALSKSLRRGRNQLHLHDGESVQFCRTA